jgi:hypothetical protein
MTATTANRRFNTGSALDGTPGRVVVVGPRPLNGVVETVVVVLGPPAFDCAVAATTGTLKAMTVATTQTARQFPRLILDTLARLSRPL